MSTVKTNNAQIGQSATATNNFTWYQPASPDGTVRLGVGNSGATSADVMTLNSSGNVGIGTSSPAYRLQVRRAGGAGSLGISIDNTVGFTRDAQYYAVPDSTSGNSGHAFYVRNASATDNLAMRIEYNGNVGIGTSSPASKVQITGGNTFSQSGLLLGSAGVASGYIWTTDNLYVKPNSGANTVSGNFSIMDFSEVTKIQMYSGTGSIGIGGATAVTSGTGITFPATQSASSDANTLDDYEEGSWTPSVAGLSFSYVYGRYVKIGRICYVNFQLGLSNTSKTGTDINIDGLPFSGSGETDYSADSIIFSEVSNMSLASGYIMVYGRVASSTTIQLLQSSGVSHASFSGGGGIGSGATIRGSFCYQTAS